MELSEHLFRRESGRLVAALTRIFGVHNLALAEDVVQDAFCRAMEVWTVRGIPDNPSAWLMTVAKNRALDIVRKERTARTFAPELTRALESEWTLAPAVEEAFTGSTIRDEQLRMMFSCCDPRLPEEVQVALVLNILCGFGGSELASAFLTSRAAMEKRLSRGKNSLAQSARLFDLSDAEFEVRLSAVRRALYLLFNEGYHGGSSEGAVRSELCTEAIRLTMLLIEWPPAASPETNALAAVSPRGGDRGRARDRQQRRKNRLGGYRQFIRPVDGDRALAGRGAQSCDCHRPTRWAGTGIGGAAGHFRC
jgi:RNA polymerase sigma factor (sigma-70 family)